MNTERNLWRHTAGAPIDAPALTDDVKSDVVIIGGGFTGNSAALHLAQAGARVFLLEAETVGHGGSGRNTGLVNAGLWTPPDKVEAILGATAGKKLNAALAAGPDLVFDLIERHGIACEATRNGTLHIAHNKKGLADLCQRHAQQLARGAPVQLLDAEETARRTGADGFPGSLFDARAGTIQPLGYVRGLARAAMAAGAVLYEHSPVTACHHDGSVWRVKTAQGSVSAKTLIQATNAYESRAKQIPAFTPVVLFQFVTKPLSSNLNHTILPGAEGCWDTAPIMSWFRKDAAGRLLVGSVGSLDSWDGTIHKSWMRRKLAELFPMAADQAFEFTWSGRIAMTSDHLPKVVQIGPDAVSIYGYSGRGISTGTVFGKAAAQWALNKDPDAFPIEPGPVRSESFTTVKRAYYEFGTALTHFYDARIGRRNHKI